MNAEAHRTPLVYLVLIGLLMGPIGLYAVLKLIGIERLSRMGAQDWAAWVQAIGSIVALGVAIWLPYRQRHAEQRAARVAAEHFAETLEIANRGLVEMAGLFNPAVLATAALHIEHAREIGSTLRLDLLPDHALVGVRGLKAIAAKLQDDVAKHRDDHRLTLEFHAGYESLAAAIERYRAALRQPDANLTQESWPPSI